MRVNDEPLPSGVKKVLDNLPFFHFAILSKNSFKHLFESALNSRELSQPSSVRCLINLDLYEN